MTTPARLQEAARASNAFHVAMSILGTKASIEILRSFNNVSATPTQVASSGGRWTAQATTYLLSQRAAVREVLLPFYRLYRALITGFTIQPLEGLVAAEDDTVSLNDLRKDFEDALRKHTPGVLRGTVDEALEPDLPRGDTESSPSGSTGDDPRRDMDRWSPADDDDAIIQEEIDRLEEAIAAEERRTEEEIRERLEQLGPGRLGDRLEVVDNPSADEQRALHSQSGRLVAADAGRIVRNAGRGGQKVIGDRDGRAVAYARIPGGESSCAFCLVMISRGPIYKSEAAAGARPSGLPDNARNPNAYHPNCDCSVIPVFDLEQWQADPRSRHATEALALYRKGGESIESLRQYLRSTRS